MHKGHLIGCGVGIAIALVVVTLSGGSVGTLGVLVAALVCPLMMIGMMWMMMGSDRHAHHDHAVDTTAASPTPDAPRASAR